MTDYEPQIETVEPITCVLEQDGKVGSYPITILDGEASACSKVLTKLFTIPVVEKPAVCVCCESGDCVTHTILPKYGIEWPSCNCPTCKVSVGNQQERELQKARLLGRPTLQVNPDLNHATLSKAKAVVQEAITKAFARMARKSKTVVEEELGKRTKKVLKAYKLEGEATFQGLDIAIENGKGSVRSSVDANGKAWATTMSYPYGYIRSTMGVDGDQVDCFLGPNPDALNAYVVHTNDQSGRKYDEDKVMLGWDSPEAALDAFLENYNDAKFFQNIETIPMDEFKAKVLATKDNPKPVTIAKLSKADEDLKEMLLKRIDAVAADEWSQLPIELQDSLIAAVLQGVDKGFGTLNVTNEDLFTKVNDTAARWAKDRAAELVGKKWVEGELVDNPNAEWAISDTTRDMLQRLVTNAFEQPEEERYGISTLADQIQESACFSPERAENVARTEVKNAVTQGNWSAWLDSGVVSQVGLLNSDDANVCELCIDLAEGSPYTMAEAPHPVEDTHPECNCSLVASELVGEGEDAEKVVKTTRPLSQMEQLACLAQLMPLQKVNDADRTYHNRDGRDDVYASSVFYHADVTGIYFVPRPWECKVYGQVTMMKVEDLVPTQVYIPRAGLAAYAVDMPQVEDGLPYLPNVVVKGGVAYVGQGHTRTGSQILAGRKEVLVRKFVMDSDGRLVKQTEDHPHWLGVDFDRTLAVGLKEEEHPEMYANGETGEPIQAMVDKVKKELASGREVRIVTARVWTDGSRKRNEEAEKNRETLAAWCERHLGQELPVTCEKDPWMDELWDDKCRRVTRDTGEFADSI